ncbi:MAG: cyclodeaminase/cyclohydrolase family protein, partial [Lachnospiraceae bacterium]|nr:cyclodeaminase/cyclohydrolase family protein [Lachnospiraceae bacterium]
MADLKNLSVEEFAAVTASDAPAPGGGSVSALAGALGAALAEMVANLTVGKAKYAEVEDEMKELSAKGAEIRSELIAGIQKDTESFTLYMNALGMPKETDEEKAARREAMQNGLKEAAKV